MKGQVLIQQVATVEKPVAQQRLGELTLTFEFYRPPSAAPQEREHVVNEVKDAIVRALGRLI